ncbi:MAG: hypothetical protein ACTSQY_00440 [Candidatus Odinarchaeia archaeon]
MKNPRGKIIEMIREKMGCKNPSLILSNIKLLKALVSKEDGCTIDDLHEALLIRNESITMKMKPLRGDIIKSRRNKKITRKKIYYCTLDKNTVDEIYNMCVCDYCGGFVSHPIFHNNIFNDKKLMTFCSKTCREKKVKEICQK